MAFDWEVGDCIPGTVLDSISSCILCNIFAILLLGLALAALLAIFIQQIIFLNGAYFASSILAREHDAGVASEIYYRISLSENHPGNDDDIQLGAKGRPGYNKLSPTGAGSTLGESFFDWDNGNPDRIASFIKLNGYTNFSALPKEQLKDHESIFSEMGEWPSDSSIKRVGDGLFLFKLSDD